MSTKQGTADFIVEQLAGAGHIRVKKMFGEYAVYCDEKVVGLICDDQLFIKPTTAALPFAADCVEAPPYPGAKMYYRVSEEKWEDPEWLCRFVRETADILPLPIPKKK